MSANSLAAWAVESCSSSASTQLTTIWHRRSSPGPLGGVCEPHGAQRQGRQLRQNPVLPTSQ
eukprot:3074315-Pyramimonas_sp.AAC.1